MGKAQSPIQERFTREQVLHILGFTERQLKTWERQGLVPASRVSGLQRAGGAAGGHSTSSSSESPPGGWPGEGKDRTYTFSDLARMRVILRLRQRGVPPAQIRSLHAALQARLAGGENPWSAVEVETHGRRVAVRFQGATLEPLTGQLLLEYVPAKEGSKIRRFGRPNPKKSLSEAELQVRAERLFQAGLRYEESEETLPKAIRAYQRARELNPRAVGAHINLGTIYYNLGQWQQAEQCYRTALSLEPRYALVHFNLANVFDEKEEPEKARQHYEEAVRLNPNYADPHYNLALVYEKLGLHGKARRQWLCYLKLDTDSDWAAFARRQLAKTTLPVISRPKQSGTAC